MATPDAPASSSTVAPSNRGWALEKADSTVRIKPRRPYTPYNLFYLLERELVVQGNEPSVAHEKASKKASLASDRLRKKVGERPEDDIPIPFRYKGVVLLPYWYEPNLKEKRKHRKTHGKISFKDLTGIISKNWANIDAETKDYCTRVSEIGRKRYKETMTKYNASQKIIQLKKEHAAMENARIQRMEQFKKKDCNSPSRPDKGDLAKVPVVTPDRNLSHHAPIVAPIVTPSNRSGYDSHSPLLHDNRIPMYVPRGAHHHSAHHAFHHYGPPPPLPPPMPHSMQGQLPPSMSSMYHHQHHQNHQHHQHHQNHQHNQHNQHHQHHQHHQHRQLSQYNYPQPPPMNKSESHGCSQAHKNHVHKSNNGHHQANKNNVHKLNSGHHQANKNHVHKLNNGHHQGNKNHVHQLNNGRHQAIMRTNNGHGSGRGGNNFFSNPHNGSVDVTVNVKVSMKKENKSSMTHDEAMRLCNLMDNNDSSIPNKQGEYEVPLADTLLRELPSFDFPDHHSLSSEDDHGDSSRQEIAVDALINQVENQEENDFDFIPLDLGGEETFPDFPDWP